MISIVLNQRKNQNMLKRKKNTCCLACEKKTDNKNIKGVALENKVGQQC